MKDELGFPATEVEDLHRNAMDIHRDGEQALASCVRGGTVLETNDDLGFPEVTVEMLAEQVQDEVEHMVPQGVYFRPTPGARCMVLSRLGDPSNRVALGAYDRHLRPIKSCAPGEGGLYGRRGWVLFVDNDNVLHLGGGAGRTPQDEPVEDPDADDAKAKPAVRIHPDGRVEVLRKDGEPTLVLKPDGSVVVHSSDIRLGGEGASDKVVTESKLQEALQLIKTHTHPSLSTVSAQLNVPEFPPSMGSDSVLIDS